jgi:hypothetical protein
MAANCTILETPPRSVGRPREPVPGAITAEVLDWLSEGRTLVSYCSQPGRPSRRTVHDWRNKDPGFRQHYDIARQMGFDYLVEEVLEIADEAPTYGRADRRFLARQRLRIKTRFWLMSRWYPKGRPS